MAEPNDQGAQEEDREPYPEDAGRLPAPYSDMYYINWWPGHLRIAFGEALYGKTFFHAAVVMPISDAESLAHDILEAVEKLKAREQATPKPAKS